MDATHGQEGGEVDLLASAAMGHQPAFERLYGLYEKRVYHYVCTLVFDVTLAEEIVSDTMLAVWRGAGTFTGTSRVSTWIFGIARHKALDAIRRASRHHQREVELDGAADVPNSQGRPDEGVMRDELAAVTQRALAVLSREHQEILRLVFYEELPYEDISVLVGIPVNTVKTRVFYAKQRLKEQLERMRQRESIR